MVLLLVSSSTRSLERLTVRSVQFTTCSSLHSLAEVSSLCWMGSVGWSVLRVQAKSHGNNIFPGKMTVDGIAYADPHSFYMLSRGVPGIINGSYAIVQFDRQSNLLAQFTTNSHLSTSYSTAITATHDGLFAYDWAAEGSQGVATRAFAAADTAACYTRTGQPQCLIGSVERASKCTERGQCNSACEEGMKG